MANFLDVLGPLLGSLSGLGSSLQAARDKQDAEALAYQKLRANEGTFEPSAAPDQTFLQRLLSAPLPQGMVRDGGGYRTFRPYQELGDEGAIALGLSTPKTVPAYSGTGPWALPADPSAAFPAMTPEGLPMGTTPAAVSTTQQVPIPGAARTRLDPKTSLALFIEQKKEEAKLRIERFKIAQEQARQAQIARLMADTDINTPLNGFGTGATATPGPSAPLPRPAPQARVTVQPETGQPGAVTPANEAAARLAGLPPDVQAKATQIFADFIGTPPGKEVVSLDDLTQRYTAAGVPLADARAFATAHMQERLNLVEQNITAQERRAKVFAPQVKTPGDQSTLQGMRDKIRYLYDERKSLQAAMLKQQERTQQPLLAGETALQTRENQLRAGTPSQLEALASLRNKTDPQTGQKIIPPGTKLADLDDKQTVLVNEEVHRLEQQKAGQKASLAEAREQQKFQRLMAPAQFAMKSLTKLVDSNFTVDAPDDSFPNAALGTIKRAGKTFLDTGRQMAQTKGRGTDLATYHDAATAHVVTITKALTGTGRMAFAEVLRIQQGLPSLHGDFGLQDTKQVAKNKLAIIQGMLNAAAKLPANTVPPTRIDIDPVTKALIEVPLASNTPATGGSTSGSPSADDDLATLNGALGDGTQ